jgi:hypothetical protein
MKKPALEEPGHITTKQLLDTFHTKFFLKDDRIRWAADIEVELAQVREFLRSGEKRVNILPDAAPQFEYVHFFILLECRTIKVDSNFLQAADAIANCRPNFLQGLS